MEGLAVGAEVGAVDGAREREIEGLATGAVEVGVRTGIWDGETEGLALGAEVGAVDGATEGTVEGLATGAAEGVVPVSELMPEMVTVALQVEVR